MSQFNSHQEKCIFCRSPLEVGASVCPVCKSWQSRWKNYLVFLGGSAGVLALLATAITYIADTVYTAVSQRDDAQVLQLQYPGYQIFDNSGTIPILLSHLELYWPQGGNTTVIVGEKLAPKQMYYHADILDSLKSSYPKAGYLANASGSATALLSKASGYPYMDKCYLLVFFSQDAPELKELNNYFAPANVKLVTVPLKSAWLFYYSTKDAALHWRAFQAVAAFLDLKKKECAEPAAVGQDRLRTKPQP